MSSLASWVLIGIDNFSLDKCTCMDINSCPHLLSDIFLVFLSLSWAVIVQCQCHPSVVLMSTCTNPPFNLDFKDWTLMALGDELGSHALPWLLAALCPWLVSPKLISLNLLSWVGWHSLELWLMLAPLSLFGIFPGLVILLQHADGHISHCACHLYHLTFSGYCFSFFIHLSCSQHYHFIVLYHRP